MTRGRRLLLTASRLLPLLPWWNAVNAENGASNDDGSTCGLYMAKSTIPDAGWGVFVGEDVQQGSYFDEDAAILVTDFVDPMPMPTLLPEYFWTSESTDSSWDASSVYSLLPGIGALANSHPTLINNVINGGVAGRRRIGYGNASTGAFSHLVGHSFSASRDLSAGQELFANGFALGHEDLPEQSDYDEVDYDDAHKQSIDWLHQNGACLDRLQIEPSRTVPYQSGAFLKSNQRAFDQGQVIATLPMIALSREHMRLSNSSSYEQLMLNYCYGHPESSLLLFPYSPIVNFVNHATNGKANVGIRWSAMNNDTTRQLSVAQLLETTANADGIVMEMYAIKKVHPGDEILLDYGRQWETAWRKHDHEWRQQPRYHEPEPALLSDTEKNASGLREKPYQSPQLIRDAFRHEIHIPDNIFPIAWKDLAKPTCTLYMADSSVAGDSNRLGMYTTKPIKAGDELALPDLMVTVEDNHDNMLRLSQLSQKTYTPWLMSQHTMNGQWALAQSEANHVAGIVPGIKMSARTNVNFNVDAKPPAQDTTLHRSVDAGAGASTTYHGSRMVAIVDIDQGQEIFVKPNSNDRNPSRQEESTPSRSVEWLTRHGQCIDNLSPGDSTVLQAGKGAFASRLIPRNTVVAPVPVVPLGRHHVDIVDRLPSDTTGAESASSQLLGKQLLLNYCYGHKNSSLLFFPSSPVVNYINHHNEPNVKLQWSTLWPPSTQVQSSSPESVAGNAEASLVMELVALRDILPGEEIFMDYGDGWSRQWREHESLTSSRLHHHDAGYVPAFRLNSRQEWLRTEHELETEPYPENVWVGCFVGNIRKIERMVAGRSGSLVEYWWEEEEGLYEDTKNLFPCDVLERISAQNVGRLRPEGLNPVPRSDPADFVEPRDRRESVAPLPVYYKVRAHNVEQARPNQQINFYPIPRNAIRFFDKPYTTDHSLRTAFRHEIQLPDDMMPPTWLDLTDGNDDDQSDPAMSSFASDEL